MSDVRCAECDCTDGNCTWIMTDEPDMRPMDWTEVAARAHEEGRRKGLEQAAQAMEARAAQRRAESDDLHREGFGYLATKLHYEAEVLDREAASLRAMKDKP